jgi:hypothetical protein
MGFEAETLGFSPFRNSHRILAKRDPVAFYLIACVSVYQHPPNALSFNL